MVTGFQWSIPIYCMLLTQLRRLGSSQSILQRYEKGIGVLLSMLVVVEMFEVLLLDPPTSLVLDPFNNIILCKKDHEDKCCTILVQCTQGSQSATYLLFRNNSQFTATPIGISYRGCTARAVLTRLGILAIHVLSLV